MRDYIRDLRRLIGNRKILVPGVRALILDQAGRLLLQEQTAFDSWSLPHGCVDLGESALEAIVRETREETGILIRRAELFGIYTDPRYSVTYPNGDEVQTFTIAFLVREWEGVPRPDGEETRRVGFFDPGALPRPLYPVHADTIEDFRHFDGSVIVR